MSHQLKGVSIKLIHPTQKITETFSKREFVVTEAGNYPQHIIFQVTQDKCSLLDSFQVNETVDVNFNLRGREWTSPQGEVKYFNSLEAWRIEKSQSDSGAPSPSDFGIPSAGSTSEGSNDDSKEADDLPF
ncbi:MAG: DUF3127 domain-containing protein [Flavobacteriia bacterium]|jgi:hypothetical protein|nr:DUF3127 domain-containing protein [Flavobacteriia bacterium]NBV67201.1 DUF3127 domain-containing protein [Flavobacteriia bacterium]NBV91615.1 DUF3127 domain-containing protein [Flavobacteriia bacterium]NBY40222.1 DUF3127 domain-containing protein [Flavobacteriia bacterium]